MRGLAHGRKPGPHCDHASHKAQGSTIRRYIIWRNKHAADEYLRRVVASANAA
ncbi:hypothetical protein NRK68_24705 [Streptomyces yangpuensis]|uniref:Transposase n=1 Tax=Streptomyces yangpuensis TaxID=1648182 RepID=A0ABY5Q1U9_9ACTN|nr:hypothetical protein NRK68_24705 [Streptomyces yangpuensis]